MTCTSIFSVFLASLTGCARSPKVVQWWARPRLRVAAFFLMSAYYKHVSMIGGINRRIFSSDWQIIGPLLLGMLQARISAPIFLLDKEVGNQEFSARCIYLFLGLFRDHRSLFHANTVLVNQGSVFSFRRQRFELFIGTCAAKKSEFSLSFPHFEELYDEAKLMIFVSDLLL